MAAKRTDFANRVFAELTWEWQRVNDIVDRLAPLVPPGQAGRRYDARVTTNSGVRPISEDFRIFSGQKEVVRQTLWSQKGWVEFRGEGGTRMVRLAPRGGYGHAGRCLYCGGEVGDDGRYSLSDDPEHARVHYTALDQTPESKRAETTPEKTPEQRENEKEIDMLRRTVGTMQDELDALKSQVQGLEALVSQASDRETEFVVEVVQRLEATELRADSVGMDVKVLQDRVTLIESAVNSFFARMGQAVVNGVNTLSASHEPAKPSAIYQDNRRQQGGSNSKQRRRNRGQPATG